MTNRKYPRDYAVKDSGERRTFPSGMVRDTDDGKVRYDLVLDGPMFERWAEHLTKGAKKYEARNWMKASGQEEHERFRQSALRHFLDWYRGKVDEDHGAAVMFNINGAEYCDGGGDVPAVHDHKLCVNPSDRDNADAYQCPIVPAAHDDSGEQFPIRASKSEAKRVNLQLKARGAPALGLPIRPCRDHYAHAPHKWSGGGLHGLTAPSVWCSGVSYNRT